MHTYRRILTATAIAITSSVAGLTTGPGAVAAATDDLIISQYTEGSSFNKAVEFYNGTGAEIDLAPYELVRYANGNTSGTAIDLSGTIADGETYVIANPRANDALLGVADDTSGTVSHNGNDAYELRNGGTIVDSFGQVGNDPGSQWSNNGVGTRDQTLTRKPEVCAGDVDSMDAFDPSVEWTSSVEDSADGFGSHTANCGDGDDDGGGDDGGDDPAPTPDAVLNEFSVSTTGTDVEYVEVFGEPTTDYSSLSVLEVEGDDGMPGTVEAVVPVGSTDAAGLWATNVASNTFENDTLSLLLVDGFSGSEGDDLDTDDDGTLDATPWNGLLDSVAVSDGDAGDLTYGSTTLGPNYDGVSSFPPGGASRVPDGTDTDTADDWVRNDFDLADPDGDPVGSPEVGEAYNTPGAPNEVVEAVEPPSGGICAADNILLISDVQGEGASSTLAGQKVTVTVKGIVVADHQAGDAGVHGDLDGYFLQEEDAEADGNAATSDGIFIYDPNTVLDVQPGEQVAVTGEVTEFGDGDQTLTEIVADAAELCSPADEAPTATPATFSLPAPSVTGDAEADYAAYVEQFEGMAVTMPDPVTISEFFNYDRFGEVVLTDGRQYQPTAIHAPGTAEAAELDDQNLLSRITLDDGLTEQNPTPMRHPDGSEYSVDNSFRGGDTLTGVTGAMHYAFGKYRIQPTGPATHNVENPRPADPPKVGGDLTVVSLNVLNYFHELDGDADGDRDGPDVCGPNDNLDCRGANDAAERERQLNKIVNTLTISEPAVAGLIELGNPSSSIDPDDDPELNDIVGALNAELGNGTYDFIRTGSVGMDAIRQGIVYQPALVTPVGDVEVLDTMSFVAPNTIDPKNRPAVAQVFEDNATGAQFLVVVNHLKSKGSACDPTAETLPDDDPEAGSCNRTRTLAAQELLTWVDNMFDTENVLIVGDLNAYDQEDPIVALEDAGYVDLEGQFGGAEAYSYVFDGQLGYLDYAMASPAMFEQVTGAASWHINADEPDILSYDKTFTDASFYADDEFRSSDHDPVLVGLSLTAPDTEAPTVTVEQAADQDDPAESGPVRFDVQFSEPVTGFDADDVVTTGPAGEVTVSEVDAATYEVSIENTGEGTITASLDAGAAADAAGNESIASTSDDNSVTIELPDLGPTVTVEQAPWQSDPDSFGVVWFVAEFSEPVSRLSRWDVETSGPVRTVVTARVSRDTYLLAVVPDRRHGSGTVSVSIPADAVVDGDGNGNQASTSVDNQVEIRNAWWFWWRGW